MGCWHLFVNLSCDMLPSGRNLPAVIVLCMRINRYNKHNLQHGKGGLPMIRTRTPGYYCDRAAEKTPSAKTPCNRLSQRTLGEGAHICAPSGGHGTTNVKKCEFRNTDIVEGCWSLGPYNASQAPIVWVTERHKITTRGMRA